MTVASEHITLKPTVTAQGAKAALAAAEAEAIRRNVKVSIVVADPAGFPIALLRMDGTSVVSVDIAMGKARTAAQVGFATRQLQDMADQGHPSLLSVRQLMSVEGGVPIIVEGTVVGAVAASGAASDDDAAVANAGVAVLVA